MLCNTNKHLFQFSKKETSVIIPTATAYASSAIAGGISVGIGTVAVVGIILWSIQLLIF